MCSSFSKKKEWYWSFSGFSRVIFSNAVGNSFSFLVSFTGQFSKYLKINFPNKHVAIVAHKAPQFAFDVLLNNKTWEQAIDEDWRLEKKWQPGWEYTIKK